MPGPAGPGTLSFHALSGWCGRSQRRRDDARTAGAERASSPVVKHASADAVLIFQFGSGSFRDHDVARSDLRCEVVEFTGDVVDVAA